VAIEVEVARLRRELEFELELELEFEFEFEFEFLRLRREFAVYSCAKVVGDGMAKGRAPSGDGPSEGGYGTGQITLSRTTP